MILEKLRELQQKLKAPKSQYNKFGKYKYRSCEDILEAVKCILPEECIINITDDLIMIGDRYYIKATANFFYKDKVIKSIAFARETLNKKGMDESQITGSASSYARKYALNGLLLIDDTKDADSTNNHQSKKEDNFSKHHLINSIISELKRACDGMELKEKIEFLSATCNVDNVEKLASLDEEVLKKTYTNLKTFNK